MLLELWTDLRHKPWSCQCCKNLSGRWLNVYFWEWGVSIHCSIILHTYLHPPFGGCWWSQWVVLAACHGYSRWRWLSDTFWSTLITYDCTLCHVTFELGFGSFLCNLMGVNIVEEFCCLKECKVHFINIDSEGRAKWEAIGVLSLADYNTWSQTPFSISLCQLPWSTNWCLWWMWFGCLESRYCDFMAAPCTCNCLSLLSHCEHEFECCLGKAGEKTICTPFSF